MEWTLAEFAAHLVHDLRRRRRLGGISLERRRGGTVLGAALGGPRKAEAAFLLARHRSAIPRGVVARLIPVPDVGDRVGAVSFGVVDRWYRPRCPEVPGRRNRPKADRGLLLFRARSANSVRRPPRAA